MAALRPCSAALVFTSRAAMPRVNSLPFRPALALTPAAPAHLLRRLPKLLGVCSAGAAAVVPTAAGLGAGGCRGVISRGLAGSRDTPSDKMHPGKLTRLIKQCGDVGQLRGVVEEHAESFNHIHVSDAWVELRRMPSVGGRGEEEALIQQLQDVTGKTVQEMDARLLANVVRSMASLHESGRIVLDDALAGKLLDRAKATVGDFNPQDVSKLAWALATMGVKPDAVLLEAMQKRAIATAGDFKAQNVANLVWALAKMGVKPEPGLLKAMQGQAIAMAGGFTPQAGANIVWALATLGVKPDAGLLEAIEVGAITTTKRWSNLLKKGSKGSRMG